MELIDTDVLIDVQRGFAAPADWFATDRDVGIPGFVVMELVQDARNSDEVQKALALVDGLEVVWPSEAECQTALEQFPKLHLSHGLGLLDALIAATAVWPWRRPQHVQRAALPHVPRIDDPAAVPAVKRGGTGAYFVRAAAKIPSTGM